MRKYAASFLSAFPLVILLPYLVTIVLNGSQTALVMRFPKAEACLPMMLSLQIKGDYELEAVKAQAVIARSNLYRRLSEGEGFFDILGKTGQQLKDTYWPMYFPFHMEDFRIYEKAADQTKEQVLSVDGELKLVPYHELSCGMTRDGEEVLHSEEYSYLKAVDSRADKDSPEYLSSSYVPARQMPKRLVLKSRDRAGYVTRLTADGNLLEGEAFRLGMGLSSANFKVQKIGARYRFLCKGKGHGLGFSQYGGNVLAKSGSTFTEILEAYFPEMEIKNICDIVNRLP